MPETDNQQVPSQWWWTNQNDLLNAIAQSMVMMSQWINSLVEQGKQNQELLQSALAQPAQKKEDEPIDITSERSNNVEVIARVVDSIDQVWWQWEFAFSQAAPNDMIFASKQEAQQRCASRWLTPMWTVQQQSPAWVMISAMSQGNCQMYPKSMSKVEYEKIRAKKDKFL